MTSFYWQLQYPGGSLVTEPRQNASIMEGKLGAVRLNVVDESGDPVSSVPLIDDDGNTYLPVFYRVKSLRVNALNFSTNGHPQLDATVFGRARTVNGWDVDGTLRAFVGTREIDVLPQELVSRGQIERQLNR